MARRTFRGFSMDPRTAKMLTEVEKILGRRLYLAQGPYNGTKVGASAGTHAGGGVVDVRTQVGHLTRAQKIDMARALRTVGFAAWLRPKAYNADGSLLWGEHIHAVAVGQPDLSDAAKHQITEARKGGDGLKGDRPDPYAYLGIPLRTWEDYLAAKKPQHGKTTVVYPRGTEVRNAPGRGERAIKHRPAGYTLWYTATKRVHDKTYGWETWLRLASGNWVLAKRTARGD